MRMWYSLLAQTLVVALIALSSLVTFVPRQAEAQLSLGSLVGSAAGSFVSCKVGGLLSSALQGVSAIATNFLSDSLGLGGLFGAGESLVPTNPVPTETRECTLDGMVWRLANDMLDQITRDIVAWIETGFEGSPAFVTNLNGFMNDLADAAAGQFLAESGLEFLCSPFRIDVQVALALQYQKSRSGPAGQDLQCTLSGIIDNTQGAFDRFLAGSFSEGGLPAWFELTAEPANVPIDALFGARRALSLRIANEQGEELKLLEFGQGWFSLRDENGNIITPGDFVQKKVDSWTNTYQNRLEVADNVNEVIQALVAYFVKNVLFDQQRGLLGGGSYLGRAGGINAGGLKRELLAQADTLIAQAQAQGRRDLLIGLQALRRDLAALTQSDPDYFAKLQVVRTQLSLYESLLLQEGGAGGFGEAPPPPAPVPPAPDGSTGSVGGGTGGLGSTPGVPDFTPGGGAPPAASTLDGGTGGVPSLPAEPPPIQ